MGIVLCVVVTVCGVIYVFIKNRLKKKYYLDFIFINLYFVKYYSDSKLRKLPVLCNVTVNLETRISKLGVVLFHNNSYIRCPLFFTGSSAFY